MIPSDDPTVTRAIGDARLTLLATEGDLLRLMDLDHEAAGAELPGVRVQIGEARAAIQRAGQALGAEALAEVSLEHILDQDYVLCVELNSAVTRDLITEVGALQGICALLVGDDEEDCEDDGIPSFGAQVARKRLRDRRTLLLLLVLGVLYVSWSVVEFPSLVEDAVRQRVTEGCVMDDACLSAVEGAIPSCAAEQRDWSQLLWGLIGSRRTSTSTMSSHRMQSVRDWGGLVDCLNRAAGEPVLHHGVGDVLVSRRMLDALEAP
jgi:hypothetical protein